MRGGNHTLIGIKDLMRGLRQVPQAAVYDDTLNLIAAIEGSERREWRRAKPIDATVRAEGEDGAPSRNPHGSCGGLV
jgi:hypothetical protein